MKRALIYLLSVILIVSPLLISCEEKIDDTPHDILVSDLGKYSVIRQRRANVSTRDLLSEILSGIAEVFADFPTDVVLEGDEKDASDYEILVGETTRRESVKYEKTLRYDDYGYTIIGHKIVIYGHSIETLNMAINLFFTDVMRFAQAGDDIFLSPLECKSVYAEYSVDALKVNGKDLKDYDIIYPSGDQHGEKKLAELLSECIKAHYGYVLNIYADREKKPSKNAKEIVIGRTTRKNKLQGSLSHGEMCISSSGDKIFLAGESYVSVCASVYRLIDTISEADSKSIIIDLKKPIREAIDEISIMSFNIQVGNRSEERDERVYQSIINASPDIVGLQEVSEAWLQFLGRKLDGYAYVGAPRSPDDREYNPIFYRKDMFELIQSGTKWLSETPNTVSKLEDSSYHRIMTYALLKRRSDGRIVLHINTHLDHISEDARVEQVKIIAKILEDFDDVPTVLTGDFNTYPGNSALRELENCGYYDSSKISPKAHIGITWHNYGSSSNILDFCYIDTAYAEPILYSVLDRRINGEYPSDHHPIYVELILK